MRVVSATTMMLLPQSPHFRLAQTSLLRQQPIIGDHVQQAPGDAKAFFPLAFFLALRGCRKSALMKIKVLLT
jgi:hypothetical protein